MDHEQIVHIKHNNKCVGLGVGLCFNGFVIAGRTHLNLTPSFAYRNTAGDHQEGRLNFLKKSLEA